MNKADVQHERVPTSAVRALERGDINLTQLGLLVFLVHKQWRDGAGDEPGRPTRFTLAGLKEATAYPFRVEQLRRDLHGLAEALDGCYLHRNSSRRGLWEWSNGGATVEQASTGVANADAANPHEDRAYSSTASPPGGGPPDAYAAADTDEELFSSTEARYDEPTDETSKSLAAAAEPATEQAIDEACRRFGADRNIIVPLAHGFTKADLADVVARMERRIHNGSADDVPALFHTIVKSKHRERRQPTVAFAPPDITLDEELANLRAEYERSGEDPTVYEPLIELRRRKRLAQERTT